MGRKCIALISASIDVFSFSWSSSLTALIFKARLKVLRKYPEDTATGVFRDWGAKGEFCSHSSLLGMPLAGTHPRALGSFNLWLLDGWTSLVRPMPKGSPKTLWVQVLAQGPTAVWADGWGFVYCGHKYHPLALRHWEQLTNLINWEQYDACLDRSLHTFRVPYVLFMVSGYKMILATTSAQWNYRRKQRESPLATPFVLQLNICDSHMQPAVPSVLLRAHLARLQEMEMWLQGPWRRFDGFCVSYEVCKTKEIVNLLDTFTLHSHLAFAFPPLDFW